MCTHTALSEILRTGLSPCPYGEPGLGIRDPRKETERVAVPPSPLRWETYVAAARGDLPLRGSGDLPERSRRFADRRL